MRLRWTSENSFTPPPRSYGQALVDRDLARLRVDADEVRPAHPDQRGPDDAQHQRGDGTEHAQAARAPAAAHGRAAAEARDDRGHRDQRLAVPRQRRRHRARRERLVRKRRHGAWRRRRAEPSGPGSTTGIGPVGEPSSVTGIDPVARAVVVLLDDRHRLGAGVLVGLEPECDRGHVVLTARGVRGVDERVHGGLQRLVLTQRLGDRGVVDEAAQPVGAEQDHVARARRRRPRVDVDLPVGAERARDHRALRVLRGLLGRERSRPDPLRDQRVVVGEARQHSAAPEVRARVADVREGDARPADERRGHRRAHARCPRILGRALGDAPVGEPDGRCEALLVGALRDELGERLHRDARGELAGERAAHAVGDGEERRLGVVGVLVLAPDPAGVRCGREFDDAHGYSS